MKKLYAFFSALLIPTFALAQNTDHIDNLVNTVIKYAQQAITFLMLLATIFFILAVINLIRAKDATKQKEAQSQLKNAIIGLAVMVCVWGLIKFAASTLGISTNGGNNIALPCPPGTTERLASNGVKTCQ